MRVISCKASHTSCANVLGGLGGIELDPKVSLLCSRSTCDPLRPGQDNKIESASKNYYLPRIITNIHISWLFINTSY